MKTVYELFSARAESLLTGLEPARREAVLAGVRSYLGSRAVCVRTQDAARRADREWARFEGASAQAFCAFFETFALRERISRHADACAALALERLRTGAQISRRRCADEMAAHQAMAAALVSDRRYTAWLDGITEQIGADLLFACGRTDRLRHALTLRALADRPRQKGG